MRVILLLGLICLINAFSNWSNALKLLMKNSLQDNSSIATLKKYFGSQGEMELLIKTSLIDRKTAKKIIKNFNRKSMAKASNRLSRFLKFHNDHWFVFFVTVNNNDWKTYQNYLIKNLCNSLNGIIKQLFTWNSWYRPSACAISCWTVFFESMPHAIDNEITCHSAPPFSLEFKFNKIYNE